MQQDPSDGQSASLSILSQNNAKSPLTHSPLQGLLGAGFGLAVVVATGAGVVEVVIGLGLVVLFSFVFSSCRVTFIFVRSIT